MTCNIFSNLNFNQLCQFPVGLQIKCRIRGEIFQGESSEENFRRKKISDFLRLKCFSSEDTQEENYLLFKIRTEITEDSV